MKPMLQPGLLQRTQAKLMKPPKPPVPAVPRPGSFGISTKTAMQGTEYPVMSSAKWKQTAKDLPIAVLGGGLGYGIGKTLAEIIGERIARTGERPGWLKALPAGIAVGGAVGAYASSRAREALANRREKA
jgi:hypothetical protein